MAYPVRAGRRIGNELCAKPRDDVGEGQEENGDQQVEPGMRVHDETFGANQPSPAIRCSSGPSTASSGIATTNRMTRLPERHATGRRRRTRERHQWRERAPEIGAEHEGQGKRRGNRAGRSQRHDEQHHGQARMREPGDDAHDRDGQQRLAFQPAQDDAEHLGAAERAGRAADLLQREQHDAKPDGDARNATRLVSLAGRGDADTDGDQERPEPFDVECKKLRRERRADVGAEHHDERDRQGQQVTPRERAEQQGRRGGRLHHPADEPAGSEGPHAVGARDGKKPSQFAAKGARHPKPNLAHAPDEQGDAPHECDGQYRRAGLGQFELDSNRASALMSPRGIRH